MAADVVVAAAAAVVVVVVVAAADIAVVSASATRWLFLAVGEGLPSGIPLFRLSYSRGHLLLQAAFRAQKKIQKADFFKCRIYYFLKKIVSPALGAFLVVLCFWICFYNV